jgi:hypothetical protein
VDLVDGEDVVLLEVRRIAARSPARSTAGPEVMRRNAHLAGDDVRERGLPRPGGRESVVERLVTVLGGVDRDAEVVLERLPGTHRGDGAGGDVEASSSSWSFAK